MKKSLLVCLLIALVFQFACGDSSTSKSTDPVEGKAYEEEITFKSNNTNLAGSIVLPVADEIAGAVVFVHGPGKEGRDIDLAKRFVKEGIAVLVYDKRGAAMSDGDYSTENTKEQINLLADDVAAAVDVISAHSRLKDKPIGLVGFSEAGWVIPVAAAKNNKVKYIGFWSGPVAKLSEEWIYSLYTSDRDFADAPPYKEVAPLFSRAPNSDMLMALDMDPVEPLKKLKVPGLWFFGKNDGNIPVDISTERLDQLKGQGSHYEYAVFAGKGHDLVKETFSLMTSWIKQFNNPAAMTGIMKNIKDEAAKDNSKPMSKDKYDVFVGDYIRKSPRLELSIRRDNKYLLFNWKNKLRKLTQIDDDSFYYHEPDSPFIFLDFDAERGRLLVEQANDAYSLDKQTE